MYRSVERVTIEEMIEREEMVHYLHLFSTPHRKKMFIESIKIIPNGLTPYGGNTRIIL